MIVRQEMVDGISYNVADNIFVVRNEANFVHF